MTASTGVPVNRRPKCDGRRKPGGDDVPDRRWDRCGVDGSEVAQQSEHVGRRDVHFLHRFEVLEVSRTMHEHARKVWAACPSAHDDLDRILSGSGYAPQIGSRPMRRERARHGEDRPCDRLFTCSRRPGQSCNPRCDQLQSTIADGPVPRCGAHSALTGHPARNQGRGGRKRKDRALVSPCPPWVQ